MRNDATIWNMSEIKNMGYYMKSFSIFIFSGLGLYLLSMFVIAWYDDTGVTGTEVTDDISGVRTEAWNSDFSFPESLYSRVKYYPQRSGKEFYIDPVNGSMANDGSRQHPWRTLEEVFERDLIQRYRYKDYPYKLGAEKVLVNPQAPVQGGDVLLLLSGNHGNVRTDKTGMYLPEGQFLVIKAAVGNIPVLSSIELRSAGYICLDGLDFEFDPTQNVSVGALINLASHGYHGETGNIIVSNCRLRPLGDPRRWNKQEWKKLTTSGILATGHDIVIRGCRMENIGMGILVTGDRTIVMNNYINNFTVDGMRGNGSELIFEHNFVSGSMKVDANHDDGFQSFLTKGKSIYTDVILRNNIFVQTLDPEYPYLGAFQGFGCFDGPYKNWEITGNTVITDDWHGITLMGAIDSVISSNIVLPRTLAAKVGPPWIALIKSKKGVEPENCSVINNRSMRYRLSGEVTAQNNITFNSKLEVANLLKRFDEDKLQFYDSVFKKY